MLGLDAEAHFYPTFKRFFPTLQRIANPYSPFDYETEDKQTFLELKARTFAHNKYPTTMIGQNKVNCAKAYPDRTYYFAFAFTDGLYWIKYDPELFKTFQVKQGGRYDRGRAEISQYCYIPIEHLSPVEQSTPLAEGPSQSQERLDTIPPASDRRP